MSTTVWVAVIACGAAAALLSGGPRVSVLRGLSASRPARGRGFMPVPSWARLLTKAHVPTRVHVRLGMATGLVSWLVVGGGWAGVVVAIGVGFGTIAGLAWLIGGAGRRRGALLVVQLPGCLDLLASALGAGAPLRAAVRRVAALTPEPSAAVLRTVVAHMDIGRSDAQAWQVLSADPVWGPVSRDLVRCADSGAAVADILGVHAAEARARRAAQRDARVRAVGVRSALPLVVCFLPAFVLVGVIPIIAATLGMFLRP